jgi:hypothetical protein
MPAHIAARQKHSLSRASARPTARQHRNDLYFSSAALEGTRFFWGNPSQTTIRLLSGIYYTNMMEAAKTSSPLFFSLPDF